VPRLRILPLSSTYHEEKISIFGEMAISVPSRRVVGVYGPRRFEYWLDLGGETDKREITGPPPIAPKKFRAKRKSGELSIARYDLASRANRRPQQCASHGQVDVKGGVCNVVGRWDSGFCGLLAKDGGGGGVQWTPHWTKQLEISGDAVALGLCTSINPAASRAAGQGNGCRESLNKSKIRLKRPLRVAGNGFYINLQTCNVQLQAQFLTDSCRGSDKLKIRATLTHIAVMGIRRSICRSRRKTTPNTR